MKTKKLFFISAAIILSLSIGFFACKKKTEDNTQPTTTTDYTPASDNAIAESAFDDVFKQSNSGCKDGESQVGLGGKSNQSINSGCATVTITPFDTTSWPKTITVDFGTTNCLCTDGKYRRGKIIISTTGRWRTSGTVVTVTTQNYYVNEYKVEGTKTITNNGRNSSNHLNYTVQVTNGKVTKPNNAGIVTWNSTRNHEWVEGELTIFNLLDDVYNITGTANGVSASGRSYTYTILDALVVQVGCRWVKDGSLKIEIQNTPTITVDYGDGTCDANATATINGVAYPFTMN